jgi:gliding motility-associated-like protein
MIFKLTPNGTRFLKNIDLTLLYLDTDNNGIVDGLLDLDGNATIEEAKLKMFWWDGFKWRLVNGTQTQDITANTVTVKTNHFSYYALFPVNSLSPEDYRPAKKIITPNGDGINDEADFSGLAEEVKIFDITGRKIRSVSAGTGQWDGKDDDGSVVESGVYIYQFKVDGTLVSGVIAVAK